MRGHASGTRRQGAVRRQLILSDGIRWVTATFHEHHGHQGIGLRVEQVIDNTSSRTIAGHECIRLTLEWLSWGFAKTQWGKHGDRGTGLADAHDRHTSDAGCRARSGLPTEVSLNGDFNVESVIVISVAHGVTPSTCCDIRRTSSGSSMPMCWKKSSTMPRVGTLAESVDILPGANHLHLAISLLGCAVR